MAQKAQASTQKFTEIIDFLDDVVIMTGGNACLVIELAASNFSLLSRREQDARIYSYASLLNSLSFPIQILIRNKRMDMSSYLQDLDKVILDTKNEQFREYVKYYRAFVQEMVTVNVVLNKAFYIIVSYSSLEQGAKGIQENQANIDSFAQIAQKSLEAKASTLLGHLQKFALKAEILDRDELIKLFYDIYNEESRLEGDQVEAGLDQTMVYGAGEKT